MHAGVSERMKQGHFLYNLMLSAPPHTNATERETDVDVCQSAGSSCWHFARQVVAISLQLLQWVSLKLYLPRVKQGLMKCPADISMAGVTNQVTTRAHTTRATTKTSNMLNDERLRLEREAVAAITEGMMTFSKYSNNGAFCSTSSGTMFWKFVKDVRKTVRFKAPWIGTFTSSMWRISC